MVEMSTKMNFHRINFLTFQSIILMEQSCKLVFLNFAITVIIQDVYKKYLKHLLN